MAADQDLAVLIVDSDDGFIDDTKGLLDGHTIYSARNMSDGQRRLVEEGIDVAVLGPTYGSVDAVRDVQMLFELRPTLPVILVTDDLNTAILRTSLRLEIKDVLESPLNKTKLEESLDLIDRRHPRGEVDTEHPRRAERGTRWVSDE